MPRREARLRAAIRTSPERNRRQAALRQPGTPFTDDLGRAAGWFANSRKSQFKQQDGVSFRGNRSATRSVGSRPDLSKSPLQFFDLAWCAPAWLTVFLGRAKICACNRCKHSHISGRSETRTTASAAGRAAVHSEGSASPTNAGACHKTGATVPRCEHPALRKPTRKSRTNLRVSGRFIRPPR